MFPRNLTKVDSKLPRAALRRGFAREQKKEASGPASRFRLATGMHRASGTGIPDASGASYSSSHACIAGLRGRALDVPARAVPGIQAGMASTNQSRRDPARLRPDLCGSGNRVPCPPQGRSPRSSEAASRRSSDCARDAPPVRSGSGGCRNNSLPARRRNPCWMRDRKPEHPAGSVTGEARLRRHYSLPPAGGGVSPEGSTPCRRSLAIPGRNRVSPLKPFRRNAAEQDRASRGEQPDRMRRCDSDFNTSACNTIFVSTKLNVYKNIASITKNLGKSTQSINKKHTSYPQTYPATILAGLFWAG